MDEQQEVHPNNITSVREGDRIIYFKEMCFA